MTKNKESFFSQALAGNEQTEFNLFEPFSIPPRPQWILDIAKKSEVELDPDGDPFQVGMLTDTTRTPGCTLTIAASQTGKSRGHLIEAIIMASGEIPISLRYDKGVNTGVKRLITPENILRFGRFDSKAGTLIDHDVKAERPEGWNEWDCGNIIGAGIYPKEKIPKTKTQIWVCTYKEVKNKMWIPRFKEIIPPYFLNKKRGVDGFLQSSQTYLFENESIIAFITYEQDYKRVEGEKERVNLIILDEEPPIRDFYISALEHSQYLRLCFSPINGLSWMYHTVYLPIITGQNKHSKIFRCSQFDTPYQKKEDVEQKFKIYKSWEIKARIYGEFSDMAGRPYYTFDITQKNLRTYVPRHSYARISPTRKPETVRDALKVKMLFETVEERGEDIWEVYEEYSEDHAYWISADIAEGNENPDAAEDASVAYIRRLPKEGEKEPVMVATLYSRMRNVEFSWMCLYAAVYYNYCLIAPEARGEDAAVFLTTIGGYPFIYKSVVTSDKTRRLKEMNGFDTTVGNRKVIFDLAGTWIYDHLDNPRIFHYELLKEYAECIVGKNGRPDHGNKGHTDCLIAWGISLYVWMFARSQIRNNRGQRNSLLREPPPMNFPNIFPAGKYVHETRKVLGSDRGLDSRARNEPKYRLTNY